MRTAGQNLRRRTGCLGSVILFLIVVLLFGGSQTASVQSNQSSVQRTALDTSQSTLYASWYEDDWGDWIDGSTSSDIRSMISDFEYFYKQTGVQPFVWIIGEAGRNISDTSALESAARSKYDALFSDSGHMLIVFREYPNASGDYLSGVYAGALAETVMDEEAREILLTCIDENYEITSYSEADMFGKAVRKTADMIMKTSAGTASTGENIRTILILGGVIFVIFFVRYRKQRRQEETAKKVKAEADQHAEQLEAERQKAQKAQAEAEESKNYMAVKCPNCGANIRLHRGTTEKCEYCRSYVHVNEQGIAQIG